MKKINRKLLVCGAAAVVGGLMTQAKADLSYKISDYSLENVNVKLGVNTYDGVLAGGIGLTPSSGSELVSVCTDFNATLYIGSTYTYASPVSAIGTLQSYSPDPAWSAGGIANASIIFGENSAALPTMSREQAAAFQLAIWAALYDSAGVGTVTGTTFSLDSGNSSTLVTDYNNYLLELTGATSGDASVGILIPNPDDSSNGPSFQKDAPQGLLVPVPEASTVVTGMLLLMSFGVCSFKSLTKSRA